MRYKHLIVLSIVAFAVVFCSPTTGFASILNSADDFAVLAGSTITNTGETTVNGDMGVWAGNTFANNGTMHQTGSLHLGDAVAQAAQGDVTIAFNSLALMPSNVILTGTNLGGLTLAPGVYKYSSDALLTGTLFLDAQNNNNAYWVFQIGTALTTAPNSAVKIINPGSNSGVFWQVGSSATLDTGTEFIGNILADQMIALNTGATLDGRALARIDAVTMQWNAINSRSSLDGGLMYDGQNIVERTPEPATMILFGIGGAVTAFIRRRRRSKA
jgi:type VI secretion system secreted protein VgrG